MERPNDYTLSIITGCLVTIAILAQFDPLFAVLTNAIYLLPVSVTALFFALYAEKVLTKRNALGKIQASLNKYKQRKIKTKQEEQPHESTQNQQKNDQQNQPHQASIA